MLRLQIKSAILLALIVNFGCFAAKINYKPIAKNILTAQVTPKVLDKLWSSYYTSNNPVYIKRIVEFVNQDYTLLLIGAELTNRNYICQAMQQIKFKNKGQRKDALSHVCGNHSAEDLVAAIKHKYPKNYRQKLDQAVTVSAAIWSLGVNQRQNKAVKMQINKIITNNPKLDYWKKIKAAM